MKFNCKINPFHPLIRYQGRTEYDEQKGMIFAYGTTSVEIKFKGTCAKLTIINQNFYAKNWIGAILDGIQYKIPIENHDNPQEIIISENLDEGEHNLMIFKRMGGAIHYFSILGFDLGEGAEILKLNDLTGKKLEVYGDSVSQGEVAEAIYYEGHIDPENNDSSWDNSYFGYPAILARKLNSPLYNNSQGGIALLNGTGYFNAPDLIGLESTYNKSLYNFSTQTKDWDFSRYTPDIVIFAIGQNDAHPDSKAIYNKQYRENWKNKYKSILNDLSNKYQLASFILLTTVLMHEEIWDKTLDEIKDEMHSDRIHRFNFRRVGKATPGHPRITEQQEMAEELYLWLINNNLA